MVRRILYLRFATARRHADSERHEGLFGIEDDHQVAAEPVADTNLEGEWRA